MTEKFHKLKKKKIPHLKPISKGICCNIPFN